VNDKKVLVDIVKSSLCDAFKSIRGEEWDYAILEVIKAEGALREILRQEREKMAVREWKARVTPFS